MTPCSPNTLYGDRPTENCLSFNVSQTQKVVIIPPSMSSPCIPLETSTPASLHCMSANISRNALSPGGGGLTTFSIQAFRHSSCYVMT